MSDGPWCSLPMRMHWKQVAKRVEIDAFFPEELNESFQAALQKEATNLPLRAVANSISPNGQGVLFEDHVIEKVEALKSEFPDSKITQTFLGSVLDGIANGSPTSMTLVSALEDAIDECAIDNSRSIKEHYLRQNELPIAEIQLRLESARSQCDLTALANEMLANPGSSGGSQGLEKQSGLDEGPRI